MQVLDEVTKRAIIERLSQGLSPRAIYLYGSHAWGKPGRDSDVDILVVVRDSAKSPHERAGDGYRLLRGLRVPVELQVVTEREFKERVTWTSSIERQVQQRGVQLFAA